MTQNDYLLQYLQDGHTITSKEAYDKLGIQQLGRCLDDLEKRGYMFDRSTWKQVPTRHGNGMTRVKEYKLITPGQQELIEKSNPGPYSQ